MGKVYMVIYVDLKGEEGIMHIFSNEKEAEKCCKELAKRNLGEGHTSRHEVIGGTVLDSWDEYERES